MYKVIVDAGLMSEYFIGVTKDNIDYFLPKDDFDYYPVAYGRHSGPTMFNSYLSNDLNIEFDEAFDSFELMDYNEILTFEFESEEDALYFQLKYVK